ncbi:hypothetical protein [Xanthocytophaga flava]|uniref:hypothetical protein n=1 Tax=Xanthocytophaga flava TaxID=3048013 RepID=UPI0028D03E90|nr:hypothetical protein [Xanthocytophaga flavus]MDJ1472859.1 hypothetical protein [Xanthocytophaga flavus]
MSIGYNHPEARKTSKEMLEIWNTCWRCGATNQLSVHHDDRDRRNNKNSNVYVICAVCHGRIHAKDPRLGKDRFKVNYSIFTVKEWQAMTITPPNPVSESPSEIPLEDPKEKPQRANAQSETDGEQLTIF